MWAWLRTPRGSTATATAAAVILALFWFMPWSRPLPQLPGFSTPPATQQPAAAGDRTPLASSTPRSAAPAPAVSTATAERASAATEGVAPVSPAARPDAVAATPDAAAAKSAPSASEPAFDVVRVEPSGAAVIAGRGEPGSTVTLLDNGGVIAQATVDRAGQFALLPPDLAAGSHYLTLRGGSAGGTPVASRQGVAVAVARQGTSKPLVAMLSPDGPVRVLSDGAPLGFPAVGTGGQGVPAVAIQAVEAAPGGRFTASGVAKAGSQSRVYLNGAFLADVTADKEGRWAVKVEKGMRPGRYVVRADELEPASGKVAHRAEVPFTYPSLMPKGGGKQILMSRLAAAAPAKASTAVAQAGATAGQTMAPTPASPGAAGGTMRPRGKDATAKATPVPGQVADATSPTMPTDREEGGPIASVVADLRTATVGRGDSLWRISRKMLGAGMNYTAIYASNNTQIRDPALIYPGQIFVVPNRASK